MHRLSRGGGDVVGGEPFAGRTAHRWAVCLDFYAVWDDERRTLQVAIPGCRGRFISITEDRDHRCDWTSVGVFDEAEYDEFTFRAKPGDLFVFYSDGIMDARDRDGAPLEANAWRNWYSVRNQSRIAWSATSSKR